MNQNKLKVDNYFNFIKINIYLPSKTISLPTVDTRFYSNVRNTNIILTLDIEYFS